MWVPGDHLWCFEEQLGMVQSELGNVAGKAGRTIFKITSLKEELGLDPVPI